MTESPWQNILTDEPGFTATVTAVSPSESSSLVPPPDQPWSDPLAEMIEQEGQAWLARVKERFEKHVWPHEDALGLKRSELPPTPSPGDLHNRRQRAEATRQRDDERLQLQLAIKVLEFAIASSIR
jgi:hypothetical protein